MKGVPFKSPYDFNAPCETHHLSKVFKPNYGGGKLGFYLPLHVLEAGFHFPLYAFVRDLLNANNLAPKQLVGYSWWLITGLLYCVGSEIYNQKCFQYMYYLDENALRLFYEAQKDVGKCPI